MKDFLKKGIWWEKPGCCISCKLSDFEESVKGRKKVGYYISYYLFFLIFSLERHSSIDFCKRIIDSSNHPPLRCHFLSDFSKGTVDSSNHLCVSTTSFWSPVLSWKICSVFPPINCWPLLTISVASWYRIRSSDCKTNRKNQKFEFPFYFGNC